MTYVVAGVTGNTGKVVAETLLAQGKSVRVIVREASKGVAWAKRGAAVAVADLSDAAAVAQALDGASGAYLLVPPTFQAPNFRAYQDRISDALVSALQQKQTPHVVVLSSVGAHLPAGNGPIQGIHYLEQRLRPLTGTHSTFLRAAYFMENVAGSFGLLDKGLFPSFTPADYAFPMVATLDIGRAAASLLLEGPPSKGGASVVDIAGPSRSPSDVARALSTILGKPIQVAEAPVSSAAATLTGFGFPPDLAALYQEMIEGMSSGLVSAEPGHRKITGSTDLEAVIRPLLQKSA
jgi:uncharacterized protein YbjT (DUF2867 family)